MSIDLDAIRRRAGSYRRAVEDGHPLAFAAGQASAEDVPSLLAEVAQLRAELDTMTHVARGNKRHVAVLTAIVERFHALARDTDGDDLDAGAEVPVAEIRRALHEPVGTAEAKVGGAA